MADSAVRSGKTFVEFYAETSPFVRGLKNMEGKLTSWGKSVSASGKSAADVSEKAFKALFITGAAAAGGLALAFKELQAKSAKGLLNPRDAAAARALDKAFKDLYGSVKSVGDEALLALAPTLKQLANQTNEVVDKLGDFIRENRALAETTLKVGFALAGLAAGGSVVGRAMMLLGPALSVAGVAFHGLALSSALVVAGLSALASPAGLAAAAVVGLAAQFPKVRSAAESALGWLTSNFGGVTDAALDAFGGIVNALKSGDIEGAGKIASAAVRLAWEEAAFGIKSAWLNLQIEFEKFANQIRSLWDSASTDVKAVAIDVWAQVQQAWITAETAFNTFVSQMKDVWETGADAISLYWDDIVGALMAAWDSLVSSLGPAWDVVAGYLGTAWDGLRETWDGTIGYIGDAWDALMKRLTSAWTSTQDAISEFVIRNIIAPANGLDADEVMQQFEEDKKTRPNGDSPSTTAARQRVEQERQAAQADNAANAAGFGDRQAARDSALQALRDRNAEQVSDAARALAEARTRFRETLDEANKPKALKGPSEAQVDAGKKAIASSVVGTFSAAGAAGLGVGGNPAQETAKNTAAMLKKFDRLTDETKRSKPKAL